MERPQPLCTQPLYIQSPNTYSPHSQPMAGSDNFLRDVLAGLSQTPKTIHPKYFYDRQGSVYFDRICALEEYYLYQAELTLLARVADDLVPRLQRNYAMVEFGAGSLQKVKFLLSNIRGIRSFMPIDISGEHLRSACQQLQSEYPDLSVQPLVADFSNPVRFPTTPYQHLGFFPGSTIGNFSPDEAQDFLVNAGKTLGVGSYLLIGVDTKKSPQLLHAAYNDSQGITAQFNRNILQRINRELQANFEPDDFVHYAFYNPAQGRVEMHLVSSKKQTATIQGIEIQFSEGESIHTENSYKYTPQEFSHLAQSAGWQVKQQWLAKNKLFATCLLHYRP
jgi:dimethylhistidine N-methyltransferase